MDLGSQNEYPSCALSNFAAHEFYLDGVRCASMEGFLQSLKCKNPEMQKHICSLIGIAAKRAGRERNDWKKRQKLYWQGKSYDRRSVFYQQLLDRAYDALGENPGFRKALKAAGNAVFTHSVGKRKEGETVLTVQEFCSRLNRLRSKIFGTEPEREKSEKMKKFLI